MRYITIDGFENLTPQQCFDMALAHVRKTQKKSVGVKVQGLGGTCVYGGIGCAASVFLKDPAAADRLNNSPGWTYLHRTGYVPATNATLIADLQNAHDGALDEDFMRSYETEMQIVAKMYSLEYTAP